MLDRLPTWLRHAIIVCIGVFGVEGLQWLVENQATILSHVPPQLVPFATVALSMAVLALTALTRQYGTGKGELPTDGGIADQGADATDLP